MSIKKNLARIGLVIVSVAGATLLGTGLASAVDWAGCEHAGGVV